MTTIDLYGEVRVAEEWRSDSAMRGRPKQTLGLMNGGYRMLVASE